MTQPRPDGHHVVIIGGGFGGLYTAQSLRRAPCTVTLIDRRNFHLFQPLLYQVATGGLSPANIAAPLRSVLKRHADTRVLLGEVIDVDTSARTVILRDGSLPYDTLVVATGASHTYFGHPEWESFAPGLKTIEDATEIRRRVFLAFETAEREDDPALRRAWMTFVVVGGGPTGVELAGALGELAQSTLRRDFRHIDTRDARVLLIENGDRVLGTYDEKLSVRAVRDLERLGVTVRTKCLATDIQADRVTIRCGETSETIAAQTTLWAAGVQASSLGQRLAERTGVALDRAGRVMVNADLTIPGHPEVFVLGDLANDSHQTGKPLPGVAPVAIQQGRYVARAIEHRLAGRPFTAPFRYHDRGSLATIGRAKAVAQFRWLNLSGFLAWLAWLFIHVLFLIEFQNRILVLVQWAGNYVTRGRSARLITGEHLDPAPLSSGHSDESAHKLTSEAAVGGRMPAS